MARRSSLSLAVSFVTLQGAAIGCGSSGKTATGTGAETGSTSASTSTSTSSTGGMTGSSSSSSTSSGSTTTGTGGQQVGSINTIAWNGGNSYLYGINYPWLTYGADFGDGPWGHLANPAQVQVGHGHVRGRRAVTSCAGGCGSTDATTRSSPAAAR